MSHCFIHKFCNIRKNFQKKEPGVLTIVGEISFYFFLENFPKIILERRVRHNFVNLCTKFLEVFFIYVTGMQFLPLKELRHGLLKLKS